MNKFLSLAFALILLGVGGVAHAQVAPAVVNVVASCGTPNGASYTAGQNRPATQDTTGKLCDGASGGITGTVTANQGTPATQNSTNAWSVVITPSAIAAIGNAPVQSSAVETGHVIKASAGNLYGFNISVDSTLSASAWAVMIFNSTTVPAAGAVTPVKCYLAPIGVTGITGAFPTPLYLGTGISIAVSSGQSCFTKTDSAHAFISGDAQ